jgi:hypothetical protein
MLISVVEPEAIWLFCPESASAPATCPQVSLLQFFIVYDTMLNLGPVL